MLKTPESMHNSYSNTYLLDLPFLLMGSYFFMHTIGGIVLKNLDAFDVAHSSHWWGGKSHIQNTQYEIEIWRGHAFDINPWGYFPAYTWQLQSLKPLFTANFTLILEMFVNGLTFCLNGCVTVNGCNWKSSSSTFFFRVKRQNLSMLSKTWSLNALMGLNPSVFYNLSLLNSYFGLKQAADSNSCIETLDSLSL